METKVCTRCNKEKELSFFRWYNNRNSYSGVCKECSCGHPPLKRFTRNSELLTEKECLTCKQILPIDRFDRLYTDKPWYQSSCKKCRYENLEKPKRGKVFYRRKNLREKYGLTEESYEVLLVSQGSKCKICGAPANLFVKPLYIDHCHTTGKVRGLLCSQCNTGLGMFKDNIETLQLAIEYLKESKL